VIDTALWLDAVAGPATGDGDTPPASERSFAEAASSPPGKLRIALSTRPVAPPQKIKPEVLRAFDEMATTLRSLGHEVREQEFDYGEMRPMFLARWLRGISDDVETAPRPELLERPTREMAWAGRKISDGLLARARRAEAPRARRINAIFDSHDVVMTPMAPHPPNPIGKYEGRGALVTSLGAASVVSYTTAWNVTGQPAASVPAGFTAGGLPLAVQLVGRPNDESTLLSLAAQIEAERGWPDELPSVD
jgi:amidase